MRRKRRRRCWFDRPLRISISELTGWKPPEATALSCEVRKPAGLPRAEYRNYPVNDQETQPVEELCG